MIEATLDTMNDLRRVALPEDIAGALYLAAMPGRYRHIDRDLAEAETYEISIVVCLTPLKEIEAKSVRYAEALEAGSMPFEVRSHPIQDFGHPTDAEAFAALVVDVTVALRDGERVMIHCAGGIGRTGLVASCVLRALGVEYEAAVATVRAAGSHTENTQQKAFVREFSPEQAI
jgi:protein-tyrosine phosphatase